MIISAYPPHKSAGMERGCQRLAEALCRRGHRVTVLTQAHPPLPEWSSRRLGPRPSVAEPTWAGRLTIARVLRPVPIGPLWGLTLMAQVRRWMRQMRHQWNVCVCQKLDLHAAAAAAQARRLGKPCTALLVNAGDFSDIGVLRGHKGGETLLRRALRADGFFALSCQSEAELQGEGVPAGRIRPYRYFVDTEHFQSGPEPGPEAPLLFLGRFHRQKNIPLLIDAFERHHAAHPEARLRLVGDGPEAGVVRSRITRSPASQAVTVVPWTDDPVGEYQRAAAVVTASDAEGLSNVLLEAMACGAPVVTTEVSGAPEVLFPEAPELGSCPSLPCAGNPATGKMPVLRVGRGGIMVPRGNAVALADAFGQVLARRAEFGQQARARILEAYTEEAACHMFLEGLRHFVRKWQEGREG